ncbi:MAG: hypothetical protein KJ831_19230 [Candidatus Eisenbacteria bacterium]|nr:hypothetical protein [Candidatus Eisenbacteria bacterium]
MERCELKNCGGDMHPRILDRLFRPAVHSVVLIPVLSLILLLPASALPAYQDGSPMMNEGPFGGHVQGMIPTAAGSWVLWTDDAGPFIRDEGGDWRSIAEGLPITNGRVPITAMASCTIHPEMLFAALLDGWIFRSTNSGMSWDPAGCIPGVGETIRLLAPHPGDPTRIFALTRNHLYRSDNGGRDWMELLRPANASTQNLGVDWSVQVVSILIDPLRPGTALVVTRDQGTFRTADWGQRLHWFRDNLPGPVDAATLDPTIGTIAYTVSRGDLYRSVDAGESWEFIGFSGRGALGRILQLRVDPGWPSRLLALAPGADKLKISEDGGFTWQTRPLPQGETVRTLVLHPLGCEEGLFLGTDHGVWKSRDVGRSWTRFNEGLQDIAILDVAPASDGSGRIWAATDCGLMSFNPLAAGWEPIEHSAIGFPVENLLASPSPSSEMWILGSRNLGFMTADGHIQSTLELPPDFNISGAAWWKDCLWYCGTSGDSLWMATWEEGIFRPRTVAFHEEVKINPWICSDPCDEDRLILGTGSLYEAQYEIPNETPHETICEKPGGGLSWSRINTADEFDIVWDVAWVLDECLDLLLATDRGLFLFHNNSEMTLERVGPGASTVQKVVCDPIEPTRWFIQADGTVYLTADSGRSWKNLDIPWMEVSTLAWDAVGECLVVGLQDKGVGRIFFKESSNPETSIEPITISPNPFRGETHLSFNIPVDIPDLELRIYSVYGDLVRTVHREGPFPAGALFSWNWDGTSDAGHSVAAGVYIFRTVIGGQPYGGKAHFLR